MAVGVVADVVLRHRQRLALRDAQLPGDQIDAVDQFGHRMLDLQPRVHFQEVERAVLRQQELHRAGANVIHGLRCRDRSSTHALAQRGIDGRARRFLDDLLVAALNRAVALAEMHDGAMAIAEHLDLDMAGIDHRLFDQQLAAAKGVGGLRARRSNRVAQFGFVMDQPHSASAAAGRRLDHHRQAGLLRFGDQRGIGLVIALVTRHAGHAGRQHQPLRGALVAHCGDRRRVRTDEHQTGVLHGLREVGAFGQEAIARMDGIGAAGPGSREDRVDRQVAVPGRSRSDAHGFVGRAHMQRAGVGIAVDGDRAIALRARAAQHADRDLATVGNQNLAVTLAHVGTPDCVRCSCCSASQSAALRSK